jgi:hypothetical protein
MPALNDARTKRSPRDDIAWHLLSHGSAVTV